MHAVLLVMAAAGSSSSSFSLKRDAPGGFDDQVGPKKRLIAEDAKPLEGMTKAELQAALNLPNQSFKELREIAKKLERYPPISRESEVDASVEMADLVMKKYSQPQIFCCFRCDHTKTSNMKAKWRSSNKPQVICGSCFDHLTRCVIPYKGLPAHQKPEKCIHKVPRSIQKQFR